jgi:hypothetical protein
MEDAGKRAELTQELRRARGWILGVGIMMVVFDQIMFQIEVSKYDLSGPIVDEIRNKVLLIDGILLAFFVGMFFLARVKPVLGCVLALVAFWGIQFYVASASGEDFGKALVQGILVKILFTLALVKGIKSASRAEKLQSELGKVFE